MAVAMAPTEDAAWRRLGPPSRVECLRAAH